MTARLLFVLGVVVGGAALWAGLDYYLVPIPERPFSELHAQFGPSGLIGQGYGIVGTAMMVVGVGGYEARKRVRWLSRLGSLKSWLHVHIFLCLLGPFLVLLHTTFKFGGLVAIAFWSMALVVASGVFGRWVYVWIPKTANGRFVGRDELRERIARILSSLQERLGGSSEELLHMLQPPQAVKLAGRGPAATPEGDRRRRPRARRGIVRALWGALRFHLGRRAERAWFHERLASAGIQEPQRSRIVRELEEERRIEQQLALLDPFQAAFRYWHAFHLPLALVMLLVLVVHVGVAVAFGYTWIWAS